MSSSSSLSGYPLDKIPVQQPPDGQTSNFVDPPSLGPQLVIVDAVFTSIMLIIVLLRILVRWKWAKVWELSDYACIISAIGSVAHMAMDNLAIKEAGYGRHMWDVPVSWVLNDKNVRLMSSNGIIFPVSIFFAKASILLLYLRIFSVSEWLRTSVHIGLPFMALFYTAMLCAGIAAVVKCVGIAAGSLQFCDDIGGPGQLVHSAFNVVTDFWILVLPMPLILKLQLPRARKIGLVAVFSAGLVACGASTARLAQFAIRYHSEDTYWDHAVASEVSAIEMNIAIIVSCATSLPQVIAKSKTHLHSTASSLRRRLASLVGSENVSRKPSNEVRTEDLELDSFCELRDSAAPVVVVSSTTWVHSAKKSPSGSVDAV